MFEAQNLKFTRSVHARAMNADVMPSITVEKAPE
jgi:hypothetical protein